MAEETKENWPKYVAAFVVVLIAIIAVLALFGVIKIGEGGVSFGEGTGITPIKIGPIGGGGGPVSGAPQQGAGGIGNMITPIIIVVILVPLLGGLAYAYKRRKKAKEIQKEQKTTEPTQPEQRRSLREKAREFWIREKVRMEILREDQKKAEAEKKAAHEKKTTKKKGYVLNPKIIDYVKRMHDKGVKVERVVKALTKKGWSTDKIVAALAQGGYPVPHRGIEGKILEVQKVKKPLKEVNPKLKRKQGPLIIKCRACGSANPADYIVCDICGAKLVK